MKMRNFIIFLFAISSFAATAQITGPSATAANVQSTYYFDVGVWQSGGVTWTAAGGTVHSTFNPGKFTTTEYNAVISFQGAAGSRTITATKTSNGAFLDSHTVSVVIPNLNSGSIGSNQLLCYNSTAATLTSSSAASGGTGSYSYQWQSKERFASWINISGATGASYAPGTVTVPKDYRRRVISGTQTAYSNEVDIDIAALARGTIGNPQTLCYNGNPSTITNVTSASGGLGGITYQWQSSTNGSSFSNISGATGSTYNPGALTSSRWYRRGAISCGQTSYTPAVKVTIYSDLTAGSIGNAQTVCYNGDPSTLSSSSSAGGSSGTKQYQWQYSTNGSSGWTNLSGATSTTYNPGALTSNRWYRRRVRTATCSTYKYTSSVKVTVRPTLNAGSVGNAQTICYAFDPAAFTSTAASGGDGNYAYQWQYYTGSTWNNLSGATGATYNPPVLTATRNHRRRVISCGETKYSGSVKVTVQAQLTAGSIGNAQTLCYNGNPTAFTNVSSPTAGNGSYLYQWQYSTNGTSGWTNISGQTSNVYDPGSLTSSRWYRRRVRSSNCTDYKYSNTVKVTIYPNLTAGGIGNAQTVCYNGNPSTLTSTSSASGGNGHSYQWQHRSPGGSWSNISSATSTTYNPPSLTATKEYRRRVISCGQTVYTNTQTVTVRTDLNPGSIGNAQTLCYNGNPATLSSSGSASGSSGTYQYQWESSTNGSSGWTGIPGATSTTYNPGALTSSRWYRRRVRTSSCSDYRYTNSVKVTIHSNLAAGSISNAQTVCYNGNPSALTNTGSASGSSGTKQYQWQISSNGSSGWSNISGATSTTYDPGALTANRWYRRRVRTSTCSDYKYTSSVKVTVYSNLAAGSIGGAQTVCYNGDPSTLSNTGSPSGGNGTYHYQWQYSTNGSSGWTNVSGATSSGYNPGALTSSRWYRRRAKATSCTGYVYTSNVKVTVNPTLTAGSIGGVQSVCEGDFASTLTSSSAPSGGTGSYSYQWKYYNGSSWVNAPGTSTNSSYLPSAAVTSTINYKRYDTSCGQTLETNAQKIWVTTIPTSPTVSGSSSINPGASVTLTSGDANDQWFTSASGGSPFYTGASRTESLTTNTTYYVGAVNNGAISGSCESPTRTAKTVAVNLLPGLTTSTPPTTCYGCFPATITAASPQGATGSYAYQWQLLNTSNSTFEDISGATAASYSPFKQTVASTYRREVTSGGAIDYSDNVFIDTYPELVAGSIIGDQSLCSGEQAGILNQWTTPQGGDNNFVYEWEYGSSATGPWTPVSGGSNSYSYTPTATITQDRWYIRTVTSVGQTKESNAIKLTHRPDLVAGSISGLQTICYDGSASLGNVAVASQGDGIFQYQWESRPVGGSWTPISGATLATYFAPSLSTSTEFQRKVTSCGQEAISNSIIVTVNDSLVPGSIAGEHSVCEGGSASTLTSSSVPTGGDDIYTYQWKYHNGTDFVNAPGTSTNADYTPPSAVISTMRYRRFDSSCGQTLETNDQRVWMTSIPLAPTVSGSSSVNPGGSVTLTSGDADDQWFTTATGGSPFYTGAARMETLTTNTTYYVGAINYGAVDGSCESPTRTAKTVTVNLIPGLLTSTSPTVCYGCFPATLTAATPQGATGIYTYHWENLNTTSSLFEEISSTDTLASYSPFKITVPTTYRRRVESGGAVGYSDNVLIDVYPELTPGQIVGVQSLCSGEQPGILNQWINPQGGDDNFVFEWQYGYSETGPWTSVSGSSDVHSYVPDTITQDTWYIRTVTSVGQTKETDPVKLTHRPDLVAGSIGGTQTICYGDGAPLTHVGLPTQGDSIYTYQWESRPVGGSWTEITGEILATYYASSLLTSTEFLRKESSCGQTVTSNIIIVTVNDALVPGNIVGEQSVCEGGSASTLTSASLPTGGDGSYQYQWKYFDGAAYVNAPGTSINADYTSPNSVDSTMLYKRFDTSCGQTIETNHQRIWMTPIPTAPTVSAPSSVDPGTSVTFTSGDANDEWFTSASGGASFNTGALYQETVNTNVTYYVGAINYGVVNGLCESPTRTAVTVQANLIAGNITSTPTSICNGCDAPVLNATTPQGGTGSYNYQWELMNTSTSNFVDIPGATSSSYDPPTLTDSATYQRRVMSGAQTAHSLAVVQPVYDMVQAGTISGDQSLCDGIQPAAFAEATAASGGDGSYAYVWESGNAVSGPWNPISGAASATYTEPNPITQDIWYRRTVTSLGQTTETGTVMLTYVAPIFEGIVKGDSTFCGVGVLDLSYLGGATNPIWEEKFPGGSWQTKTLNSAPMSATINVVEPAVDGVQYRVAGGSTCGPITSAEHIITVQSLFTGVLQGPSQAFYGVATNISVTLVGTAGTVNQWEESLDDGANWTVIPNSAGLSSIPEAQLAYSKKYRALIHFTGCSPDYTNEFGVQVTAAGFAGYVDGPTVTAGATNSGALVLAGSGTETRWYSSPLGSSWTQIGTGNSYTFQDLSSSIYYKAERDLNGQTFTSNVHFVEFLPAITDNIVEDNYVKVTSLLTEETVLANVATVSSDDKLITYSYMDGLGRGIQSVSKDVTPNGGDIISFTEIQPADATIARSYLPFVSTGSDYYTDPTTAQAAYYQTAQTGMETETHPFAESLREASPRGLVLEQGAPGADWQLGGGHTVQHAYRFNTVDEVMKFDVDNIETTSFYTATSLNVRETTDENGNGVRVFTNARGQIVLKQVEQQAGIYASTASVYDIMGRLKYVFPPEAMNYIAANPGWTIATLKDNLSLIFKYNYDTKSRLVKRIVPGKGPELIVYDPYERVALTQDAIMGVRNQWAFTKYDKHGRTVYSGLYIDARTRSQLQDEFDLLEYDGSDAYYETWDGSAYSNTVFPTQNLEVQIENYYDTYEFQTGSATEMTFSSPNQLHSVQTNGTNQYIALNQFYDQANSIDEVTVEAWIKTDYAGLSWTANWAIVDFDRSEFYNLFVHGANGKVGFSTKGGNINDFYSVQAVNDGQWHHVAAVFDGTNKRIYVDGILDNEIVNPHSGNLLGTSKVRYGFIGDGSEATSFDGNRNNKYFQGDIGEVRIWHEVRSESQLDYYKDFPVIGNETNLIGMWTMDDMSQGLEDQTGNGYDGTLVNGPTQQTVMRPGGLEAVANPRGLPTGSKIKEGNGWRNAVVYYDEDDQAVQTHSTNHLGGRDITSNYYADFAGQLIWQESLHDNGSTSVQTIRRYEYDSRLRATQVYHQLDANPEVLLNEYTYSELGQVIEKNIGDNIQSIDYTFNSRGWLTAINQSDLSGGDGDVFGQELFYNVADASLGNTANYNGNISGMKWSSFAESNDVTERGYAYSYDKADRLTDASHLTKGVAWGTSNAFEVSGVQYDANGNIGNLNRTNAAEVTSDALSYAYLGNRLLTVGDTGTGEGFADGNTTGDDYGYDVNGNVVKDLNKGIDSIVYNHLDLPLSVILSDTTQADSLQYTYDAGGSKLRMEVWKDGAVQSKTDYVGGMRYENDTLRSIAHEEGRIVPQIDPGLILLDADGTSTTNFTAVLNVSLTSDGSTVTVTTNQASGTPGATAVNTAVEDGTEYTFRVKGYADTGVVAYLWLKETNGANLVWQTVALPQGAANEGWVSATFTVPNGVTSVSNGVLFNGNPTMGSAFHISEMQIVGPPQMAGYDYQYTLTDHQGNTRRVLSSLLEEYETTEDFEGINNGFTDEHYFTRAIANSTLPLASNDGVGLFQAGDAGAMIMFRMDRGDTIDLNVNANYETEPTNNTLASTAFGALFNSWDGAYGSGADGGISGVSNTVFDDALTGAEMAAKSGTSTAPRAYLNYIFFDLNMNYEMAGYVQVSSAALGTGVHENIAINDIISDQAGYLLAYLSNENQEAVNIHFDDFTVKHAKTNVVQAVDYYPFGAVASSYTRTAADPTKYLYNAGAELNDLTGYYETFFRNYDATIGRFNGVDIAVGKYKSQTPYNYAFNDPVLLNDPNGDDVYGCAVCSPDNSTFNERWDAGGFNSALGIGGGSYGSIGWGNPEAGWNSYKLGQANGNLWNVTNTLLGTQFGGSWSSSNSDQLTIFGNTFTGLLAGSIYNSIHDSWGNTNSGSWGRTLNTYRDHQFWSNRSGGIGFQPFSLGSISGGPNLERYVAPSLQGGGVVTDPSTDSGTSSGDSNLSRIPINLNTSDQVFLKQLQGKMHGIYKNDPNWKSQDVLDYSNLGKRWSVKAGYKISSRLLNGGDIKVTTQPIDGLRSFSFWMKFPANSRNYILKGLKTFPDGFTVRTNTEYPYEISMKAYDPGKGGSIDFLRVRFRNRNDFSSWRRSLIFGN